MKRGLEKDIFLLRMEIRKYSFWALCVDTCNSFFDFSAKNRKYSDPGTGQVRNVKYIYIISSFLGCYYLLMYFKKFKQEKFKT